MSKHLTYVYGEPGIGKSALITALTMGQTIIWQYEKPFAHMLYDNAVVELGTKVGDFPGTDRLALDVQPKVLAWLGKEEPEFVLAEGDRLANASFFNYAESLGYELHLYYLYGPDYAAKRRKARGSQQQPSWVAGRRSKAETLNKFFPETRMMHASLEPRMLARLMDDPVSERFRS